MSISVRTIICGLTQLPSQQTRESMLLRDSVREFLQNRRTREPENIWTEPVLHDREPKLESVVVNNIISYDITLVK